MLEEIATHSVRKGAGTFVMCRTTAGPSLVIVGYRMGWKMPGCSNLYLKFEKSGDYYVGRLVSGLPIDSAAFRTMPPHFVDESDEVVQSAIRLAFPKLADQSNMPPILAKCLASVIYHSDWLERNLPEESKLYTTLLWNSRPLLEELRNKILCGTESPVMAATGIPPHVSQFEMHERTISGLKEIHDTLPDVIVDKIKGIIEEAESTRGTISREYFETRLEHNLSQLEGMIVRAVGGQASVSSPDQAAENSDRVEILASACQVELYTHEWGGRLRSVPQAFKVPSVDILTGFQLWFHGQPSKRISPFREIKSADFNDPDNKRASRNESKKFCKWSRVLAYMEQLARRKIPDLPIYPCLEDINTAFMAIQDEIHPPEETVKKRKRRVGQLTVHTVYNLVYAKRARTSSASVTADS